VMSAASRYSSGKGTFYVSVVVADNSLPPGSVTGDSYTLALFCAMLGLPLGPTITGAIGPSGEALPIGKINKKLTAFIDALKDTHVAPLIFPRSSLSPESYESGPLRKCDLLINTGDYAASIGCGFMPVRSISGVIAWFTSGGYDAWHRAKVSPKEQEYMNRMRNIARVARTNLLLAAKIAKVRDAFKSLKGQDGSKEERSALKAEWTALRTLYVDNKERILSPKDSGLEKQSGLQMLSKQAKEQTLKVTSDNGSSRWYFKTKQGELTKQLKYAGSSKSKGARKKWMADNLMGKVHNVRIKRKDGSGETVVPIFVPMVVEGPKPRKAKAKKTNLKEIGQKAKVASFFDLDSDED